MNQEKIGTFLKELRNEKDITQEQLAEIFCVSRRTVSRWETGNNMPDLDILIEMADFYDVDLRELLDGERKSEKMNSEPDERTFSYGFAVGATLGIPFVMLIMGAIMTSKYAAWLYDFKKRVQGRDRGN